MRAAGRIKFIRIFFQWSGENKIGDVRNIEAHSCNNCCRREEISITYSESVFITLVIQHEMRMRPTAICGLTCCTILLHIIS